MIALAAPEGEIRGDLRQPEFADQGAVRVITVQAVMSRSPKTAEMIKPDPVVALAVSAEHLPARQCAMINIEDPDVVQMAVDDEQAAFVGCECQAVGLREVLDYCSQVPAVRIKTVDVSRADLGGAFVAFLVGVDPVARVREPDRSIRMLHNIIRAVRPVTVVQSCQDFD